MVPFFQNSPNRQIYIYIYISSMINSPTEYNFSLHKTTSIKKYKILRKNKRIRIFISYTTNEEELSEGKGKSPMSVVESSHLPTSLYLTKYIQHNHHHHFFPDMVRKILL